MADSFTRYFKRFINVDFIGFYPATHGGLTVFGVIDGLFVRIPESPIRRKCYSLVKLNAPSEWPRFFILLIPISQCLMMHYMRRCHTGAAANPAGPPRAAWVAHRGMLWQDWTPAYIWGPQLQAWYTASPGFVRRDAGDSCKA